MEAVIPMNGFMELAEEDLMVVDGGGPMLAAYPVDWKGLYNEVVGGFLGGAAGAIA
ncbi:MAG: outer rane lipoprotein SlyB, partial [Thermoanaerobacter sp.]|nr:outer rane lipoprotein SlyB [Thermoanaerobacter sp.]